MTEAVRHIDDAERRARLARRHGLAPGHRHPDVLAATRAMAALHALLREDVGAAGRTALDAEAARLTAWLDGVRVVNVYASPQMKLKPLP